MSTIKDRNGKDLTEAEDIKKRWQQYIQELYKKDLHDPDKHDGVISHLELDMLECEVKWASMFFSSKIWCENIFRHFYQQLEENILKAPAYPSSP